MRFGCCVSLLDDTILRLPQAGADYAETGFSTLRDLSLAQCRERAQALEEAGVPVPVMNLLFPGDLALVGPRADLPAVEDYLDQGLKKPPSSAQKNWCSAAAAPAGCPRASPKRPPGSSFSPCAGRSSPPGWSGGAWCAASSP